MINNDSPPDMVNVIDAVIATSEEQDPRALRDNSVCMNEDNKELQQEMEINADLVSLLTTMQSIRLANNDATLIVTSRDQDPLRDNFYWSASRK